MKKPQKKKSKNVKIPMEELLNNCFYRNYIEALPKEIQRLTIQAIDAYISGNNKKVVQYAENILKSECVSDSLIYDVIIMIIADAYSEDEMYPKAIEYSKMLNEREEDRGEEHLNITVSDESSKLRDIWKIAFSVSHEDRSEFYMVYLARMYSSAGLYEEAVEVYENNYPFNENTFATITKSYLSDLLSIERIDDVLRISDEVITKYAGLIEEGGLNISETNVVLEAFMYKLQSTIDSEKKKSIDTVFEKFESFICNMPEKIKHSRMFMQEFGIHIVGLSMMTDNEAYRLPFIRMLDFIEKEGMFSAENDTDGVYSDLIHSGYRKVEGDLLLDDKKVNKFIAGLMVDLVGDTIDISLIGTEINRNSEEAYLAKMGALSVKWYLYKYGTDSEKKNKEVKDALKYVKSKYPHLWDIVKQTDAVGFDEEAETKMNLWVEEIIKTSKGRTPSKDDMISSMVDAFERSWKMDMGTEYK